MGDLERARRDYQGFHGFNYQGKFEYHLFKNLDGEIIRDARTLFAGAGAGTL